MTTFPPVWFFAAWLVAGGALVIPQSQEELPALRIVPVAERGVVRVGDKAPVFRLRDLAGNDSQGVLELAKVLGLNFGAAASCIDPSDGGRSFGFFFRSDRE